MINTKQIALEHYWKTPSLYIELEMELICAR